MSPRLRTRLALLFLFRTHPGDDGAAMAVEGLAQKSLGVLPCLPEGSPSPFGVLHGRVVWKSVNDEASVHRHRLPAPHQGYTLVFRPPQPRGARVGRSTTSAGTVSSAWRS